MDKIFEEEIDVFALTKEEARKYYDNLYNKIKMKAKTLSIIKNKPCLQAYFVQTAIAAT